MKRIMSFLWVGYENCRILIPLQHMFDMCVNHFKSFSIPSVDQDTRPDHSMRVRLREHFNIIGNGVERNSGGKDQSKTQTHTHTVNGP